MFRGEVTIREMLNMIDHLPRTSVYAHELAQDEELAEELANGQEPLARPQVPLTEWSAEREALERVIQRLGEMIQAFVASSGATPGSLPPPLRPVTAYDRVQARLRREADLELERQLFPQLHDEEE